MTKIRIITFLFLQRRSLLRTLCFVAILKSLSSSYDAFIFLSWLTVRCNRCCIMLQRSKLAFPTLL